jgi:23S rRNA (pseudouridine1915-N3)-methyltransferase
MNYKILSIGKWKNVGENDLFLEYARRLQNRLSLKEITPPKKDSEALQKEAEAKLMLNEIEAKDFVVVLDEHGKNMPSLEFAKLLHKWVEEFSNITFCIGGALGHGEGIIKRANFKLSLGQMTLPHILARVVLAEQIYRAETINAGLPYHKE